MQTEAVATETSPKPSPSMKDPILLGVSLPLGVTVSAATQVKTAWLQAFADIVAAARAKANEKKASVTKKAGNGAPKSEQPEVNA